MCNNRKTIETTKKDFELFKKEFLKWINFFGLLNWRLFFYHEKTDEDSFAIITCETENRVAGVTLNKIFPAEDYFPENIKMVAFHEVCELLLSDISDLAKSRFINETDIDTEIHRIIRTLENTVFKIH